MALLKIPDIKFWTFIKFWTLNSRHLLNSGQLRKIPNVIFRTINRNSGQFKIPCPESVRLIYLEFIHVGQIPDMIKILDSKKSDIFRTQLPTIGHFSAI